ncbi:MAG: hypothetical protein IIV20_08490 [Bacteroidaceae bacterium]|nr:hypothetical protein [Bacteroidaceae bacterium]
MIEKEIILFFRTNKTREENNTQENFGNFCREVGQLLCRTLAITHEKFGKPTSG